MVAPLPAVYESQFPRANKKGGAEAPPKKFDNRLRS
jgi:hypothetical protein